jgi:hypothetical protein
LRRPVHLRISSRLSDTVWGILTSEGDSVFRRYEIPENESYRIALRVAASP